MIPYFTQLNSILCSFATFCGFRFESVYSIIMWIQFKSASHRSVPTDKRIRQSKYIIYWWGSRLISMWHAFHINLLKYGFIVLSKQIKNRFMFEIKFKCLFCVLTANKANKYLQQHFSEVHQNGDYIIAYWLLPTRTRPTSVGTVNSFVATTSLQWMNMEN